MQTTLFASNENVVDAGLICPRCHATAFQTGWQLFANGRRLIAVRLRPILRRRPGPVNPRLVAHFPKLETCVLGASLLGFGLFDARAYA